MTDDLLRLSVGIEDQADLIADLACALDSVPEIGERPELRRVLA